MPKCFAGSEAGHAVRSGARFTWPDAFYVEYGYLVTGEMTDLQENGATTGIGLLATYAYDISVAEWGRLAVTARRLAQ